MNDPDLPLGDALRFQAWRYASGALPPAEAATFERRLGDEQAARDALCQAVQITALLNGHKPPQPQGSYRTRVWQRLGRRPAVGRGLFQRQIYRGHPALWSALGAAAAVLLIVGFGRLAWTEPLPVPPVAASPSTPTSLPTSGGEESRSLVMVEVAQVWAELHSTAHLTRAHDEEARRKLRVEEWRQGKSEERRLRLPGGPVLRH